MVSYMCPPFRNRIGVLTDEPPRLLAAAESEVQNGWLNTQPHLRRKVSPESRMTLTRQKPKRNDPCPCGSGKLYKHCCKPSRSEQYQQQREIALAPPDEPLPGSVDEFLPKELAQMVHEVERQAPPEFLDPLRDMLLMIEESTAAEEKYEQVIAAARELEQHRPELMALDEDTVAKAAERLFAEDRFRPFRFSAEDVHRAFKEVGFPHRYGASAQEAGLFQEAILYLVEEPHLKRMARQLLAWLPEYVDAGRYLEAQLLQSSALWMAEEPEEINPFLTEMFRLGFIDWADQVRAQQAELIHEIGLEVAQFDELDPDEFRTWLREQMADPEIEARVESYLDSHPMLREYNSASSRALDQATPYLLGREDASRLLLSPEELEPWVTTLAERLGGIGDEALSAGERGESDAGAIEETLTERVFEVSVEMAPAIFTPDRLAELVADLRDYRQELLQAGEEEAAALATSALVQVVDEDEPDANRFLVAICVASLRQMLIDFYEE